MSLLIAIPSFVGITITALVLMILAIALVTPGGMGLTGHFISKAPLTFVAKTLTWPGSIALLSAGIGAGLISLGSLLFLFIRSQLIVFDIGGRYITMLNEKTARDFKKRINTIKIL